MRVANILLFLLIHISLLAQNALHFDGSDDGVNCGTSSLLDVGSKSFSIEAWIYADQFKTNVYDGSIIMKETNSNNGGFMLRAGAGGKLNFGIGSGTNSPWSELSSGVVMVTGTWYHVAATYDGSFMRLYIDGTISDSLTATLTVGGSSSTPLTLGYHPAYSSRGWNGRVDEVRIWDTLRSSSQIKNNRDSEFCNLSVPHLVGYYKLDEGTAQSSNFGVTTAKDYSSSKQNGALLNFSLSGSSSNWHTGKSLSQDTTIYRDSSSNCGPYYDLDLKQFVSNTNNFTKHFVSYTGCDSSYIKYIEIKSNSNSSSSFWVCDSLVSPTGKVYRKTGTYYDIIPNYLGCDSIITVQLKVGADSSFIDTSTCFVYTSPSGIKYNQSGTCYEKYISHIGCDSILQINFTIIPTTISSITLETCDSIQNFSKTQWLKPGDVYIDTISNVNGCDSIVKISVESLKSSYKLDVSECVTYTSPTGKVFSESGIFSDTLYNIHGCDSILDIHLTILNSTSEIIEMEECFEAILPISGQIVSSSGNYYDTLTNKQGCDSFVTVNVVINTVNTKVSESDYKLTALSGSGKFQWLDCLDSYFELIEETSAEFEYISSGQYAVEVTENQCIDTSLCFGLIGLGVEPSEILSIDLIPNPNQGIFTIITSQPTKDAIIQIKSLDGKVVEESELKDGSSHQFSFSLDFGIYVVVILSENCLLTGRLIVNF